MKAERLLVLAVLAALMFLLTMVVPSPLTESAAGATMAFGFILVAAYVLADLLTRLKLPRITGYILAGMLFGPYVAGFLSDQVVRDLRLVDDLALTFIAFAAGGELRMAMLRQTRRSITANLLGLLLMVPLGVTGALFLLRDVFPFTAGRPAIEALAIIGLAAALAVARSPSSVIAIISETRARGRFTEMALGVTVALDVTAIFVFALAVSLAEVVLNPGKQLSLWFMAGLLGQVVASVACGLVLGKLVALYLHRVKAQVTFFTLAVAFLVTKVSAGLGQALEQYAGVQFHLEPMLICITAGFVVQNFSPEGDGFLQVIDRSSLPIYTIFFALSGASLQLGVLGDTWHWALALVGLRALFIYLGCLAGGRLGGDPARFYRVSGLAFLTQAGVSLGLVKVVINRFPEFGAQYATLMVAVITLNQIIGPVSFKQALSWVGETREARGKR